MKIKAINRSASECTRERSQDVQKVHKNLDPALHPFEKAVEYTRALNAAKLDRCEPPMCCVKFYPCETMAGTFHALRVPHLPAVLQVWACWVLCLPEENVLHRVFAKPFISAFPHDDGVTCLARNPKVLNGLVSVLVIWACLCLHQLSIWTEVNAA